MRGRSWETFTVAELRAECKARRLPCWSMGGKRLRKADLVHLLRTLCRPRKAAPRATPKPRIKPQIIDERPVRFHLSDHEVSAKLFRRRASMSTDPDYEAAMRKVFSHTATQQDQGILDGKEAELMLALHREAATQQEADFWWGRYQARIKGVEQMTRSA